MTEAQRTSVGHNGLSQGQVGVYAFVAFNDGKAPVKVPFEMTGNHYMMKATVDVPDNASMAEVWFVGATTYDLYYAGGDTHVLAQRGQAVYDSNFGQNYRVELGVG